MRNKTMLYGLVWFLVLVATVTGVFYQTPGAHIQYVTVRGENATFQGSGLYKYDPVEVAREGMIWDAINLFIGLPLFAVAIYQTGRNSLRGRLLLSGLLFYFFYVYLQYATMVAFNPLFLVYVAIFALSAIAFFVNLQGMDVSRLPTQISERFPRRLFIGFTFVFGIALILLWVRLIVSIMIANQFPSNIAGMNTLQTQALDLGLVVPLSLSTGILLWRRWAWGYLLAGITLTFGFMMMITIPTWIATSLIQNAQIDLIEASPFLILCLVGLYLVGKFYWNVQEERAH